MKRIDFRNKFSFASVEPVNNHYRAATRKESEFHGIELSKQPGKRV